MNSSNIPLAHLRDTLGRLAYFQGFEPAVITKLAAAASQFIAERDEIFVSRASMIDRFYVLVSGQARLFIPLPNDLERVFALVSQGEGFGEAPAVLNTPVPYSAAACTRSHVIAINARAFRAELAAHPPLLMHTFRQLARQHQTTLQNLDICAQPSNLHRLVRFLLCKVAHEPSSVPGASVEISLPGRKRDIAAKLGMSSESLSRMLSLLARQGLIDMQGRHLRVNHPERLMESVTALRTEESLAAEN